MITAGGYPGKGGPDAAHNRIVNQSAPAQRLARQMRSIYESEQFQTNSPAPFQHETGALTNFANWVWKGNRPGSGLNALPGQIGQMFNPTSRSGLVNILSTFAGGPPGERPFAEDNFAIKSSDILNKRMEGGNFTKYTLGHAASHGPGIKLREGQPFQIDNAIQAVRRGSPTAAGDVHDALFGGEVHVRGPIPPKPSPAEYSPEVQSIADKLGIHPGRVLQQMRANDRAVALRVKQQNLASKINYFFGPDFGFSGLNKMHDSFIARRITRSVKGQTDTRLGRAIYNNSNPQSVFDVAIGRKALPSQAHAPDPQIAAMARQKALAELMRTQQLRHRN